MRPLSAIVLTMRTHQEKTLAINPDRALPYKREKERYSDKMKEYTMESPTDPFVVNTVNNSLSEIGMGFITHSEFQDFSLRNFYHEISKDILYIPSYTRQALAKE
jgi:hypothetical protein